jgi:signal peptidase I
MCLSMSANQSWAAALGGFTWEVIKVFLLAMVIILPIRYFLVQPFFVRGASMEPSFHDGEYLVIDELSYRFRQPQRGEVVVFRYPVDPSQFFIKRIVGLPGETVKVAEGRVVISNASYPEGVVLNEAEYLSPGTRTGGQLVLTLGSDEYFVLGDNRAASSDSRSWGALKFDEAVGRVIFRAFPVDRLGAVGEPEIGFLN